MNGPALVIAPLALEALLIRTAAPALTVRRSGMGHRRAARTATALAREPGVALVVMGFGGALDPADAPGLLVVASEIRDPAGRVYPCQAGPALMRALEARGPRPRYGPLASVERPARGAARAQLFASGAVAVDMESAWLAPAAAGRPLGVIRAVVDTPARELTRPWLTLKGGLRAAGSLRSGARAVAGLVDWST